jgi:hypothetical protein
MGLLDSNAPTWLPVDPISGNRLIIEPVHGAIHDGVHFTANHSKTLGSASTLSMMMTTPATATSKYVHFVCGVECTKAATWTLSECSASAGSAYTAYNNNRNSSTTDPTTIVLNPTITTYGTILETHVIGTSGNPTSVSGGSVEQRNEWLLKPATQYLVNVTTYAASSDTVITMPYYYREA